MFCFRLHANLVYFLQVLLMIFVTYVYTRNIIQFNLLSMIFFTNVPASSVPFSFFPCDVGDAFEHEFSYHFLNF
jgi:hypothetical protein